ncbi:hypothetical protein R1flu_009364 [Riccia fluitans]|uniref:Defective in cullin neddylation protein n=1 Tax=Riccia fluitans TaxID=41844 RepID=A0ABD1Z609_9MARC
MRKGSRTLSLLRPEGIEALCQDLGLAPTDIQVFLLAWKIQASRQGYFLAAYFLVSHLCPSIERSLLSPCPTSG